MSDEARKNLLKGTRDFSGNWQNLWRWKADGEHDGFKVLTRNGQWQGVFLPVAVDAGKTYTFSALVKYEDGGRATIYASHNYDGILTEDKFDGASWKFCDTSDHEWHVESLTFTPNESGNVACRLERFDNSGLSVCAYMLVEGDTPAAWAPAEGEEIAGGGRLDER